MDGEPMARGTKSKIRNLMSGICTHALRYGWLNLNPIAPVRQSAKRERIPANLDVEELQALCEQLIKTRGAFPNEESALKLLFLAIRHAAKKWTMPVKNWSQALNYFTVLWPERMAKPGRLA